MASIHCGEALAPREASWQRFASLPRGYDVYAIDSSGFSTWVVVRAEGLKNLILKYEDGTFSTQYESPYEFGDTWLTDIAFTSPYKPGWAGGGRRDNSKRIPYLLKYNVAREEWAEETLPTGIEGVITRIRPMADGYGCWLVIDERFNDGYFYNWELRGKGKLALYRYGELKIFENLGNVSAAASRDPQYPHVIFAVEDALVHGGAADSAAVFVSKDAGGTWAEERVSSLFVHDYKIEGLYAAEADGLTLYLLADFEPDNCWGIIKRTGLPGAGEYELIFLAPQGPYFRDIRDVAFRDPTGEKPGIGVDGIAAGDETTVVFVDGAAYMEKLPYPTKIVSAEAANGNGFWAAGENKVTGNFELLYHP